MVKYFKAEVTLYQTVTVNVAADSEDTARRKAKELALQKIPGARVSQIDLTLEGETQFQVGTKIKHFLFGEGEIQNLVQTTNANNDLGFRATILFSNGDTKEIHLPMPKDKLEVIVT
ncbi:hypothetical protein G3I75_20780 [Pseudomonas aeruginosa]|nr:hypothetical protein G3I75_20780 [Pseudomonas aeruginosa]